MVSRISSSRTRQLIEDYFYKGYTYETIRQFLYVKNGVQVSLRHLKRILRCLGLKRRGNLTLDTIEKAMKAILVNC